MTEMIADYFKLELSRVAFEILVSLGWQNSWKRRSQRRAVSV